MLNSTLIRDWKSKYVQWTDFMRGSNNRSLLLDFLCLKKSVRVCSCECGVSQSPQEAFFKLHPMLIGIQGWGDRMLKSKVSGQGHPLEVILSYIQISFNIFVSNFDLMPFSRSETLLTLCSPRSKVRVPELYIFLCLWAWSCEVNKSRALPSTSWKASTLTQEISKWILEVIGQSQGCGGSWSSTDFQCCKMRMLQRCHVYTYVHFL